MMIRPIVVALAIMMFAIGASADTLHGYCVSPAAPCNNTPTTNNPPYFAFGFSGNATKTGSGDFLLVGLVPDNRNAGFSLTLDGTNTASSAVTGALVSATVWNSGFLSAYLTSPTFPHKSLPLSGYLPSTQSVDPGANGYFVYLFDFGAFNYKTAAGDPTFSVGSGAVPQGTIFLAALTNTQHKVIVDTPSGGSILEAGSLPSLPPSVPEPSTLLMMGPGLIGLAGLARKRLFS
jgi:PEP-CTERM motif-containing protein